MTSAKITLLALCGLLASSAFGQVGLAYPTKLENLLHQTGVVVTSSSQPVGSVETKVYQTGSNNITANDVTVLVRTQVISQPDSKAKEYGVALQMRVPGKRSRITYVDYDELDGLLAGINKLLVLPPELPVVQAKYETKGGLIVGSYSTEKREVRGRLEFNNDETGWLQISLSTLKDFQNLIIVAKHNLDALKAAQ